MPDKPAAHPDQRLIEGLLRHDERLISEIYRLCAGKVKSWICRNSGSEDDAADIFQESLMSLYHQAREKSLVLTCPLDAFLLLIAKRMWLNELKKRGRQGVTIPADEVYNLGTDEMQHAEQLLERREQDRLVVEHFGRLGERCREIIKASLSGEHQALLSEKLGVSYGYLRKKKSECMARLIQFIREAGFQWK